MRKQKRILLKAKKRRNRVNIYKQDPDYILCKDKR